MDDINRDVIKRAASGDPGAFEQIYRTYARYVFHVALRMTRHRQDAEEITQNVFVTLYEKLAGFRGQAQMRTWIYRITVNMSINYLKKEKRIRQRSVSDDSAVEAVAVEPEVYHDDARRAAERLVSTLLDGLTGEQRACVVLRSVEGLSYAEIARVLKIHVNAVRSRLKRARERMIAQKPEGDA